MRLRTRLVATFTGVTAVALIASFAVTYAFVQRDEGLCFRAEDVDIEWLSQEVHGAEIVRALDS